MHCYERRFPEEGEIIMCMVTEITFAGAQLELLEFGNIAALASLTELSKRKIRLASSLKISKLEPMLVLRVDEQKGYIDCSKRQLSQEETLQCRARYLENKLVHNIWSTLNHRFGMEEESFYQTIVYPLQEKYNIITGIKEHLDELDLDEDLKKKVYEILQEKLAPPSRKHRLLIELTCFGPEGIDGIIAAIKLMQATSTLGLKVKYISSPFYVMEIDSPESISEDVENCVEEAKKFLHGIGGNIILKSEVGSSKNLEEIAADLEKQNKDFSAL